MKIIKGTLSGTKINIVNDIFHGHQFDLGGKTYRLKKDIEKVQLIKKEESRSAGTMFLILLLGVTIIGLIIAIPLLIAHKNVNALVAITLKDSTGFIAEVNKKEWKLLSRFEDIQLPDGFNIT